MYQNQHGPKNYELNPSNIQKESWLLQNGAITKPEMINLNDLKKTGYLPVCLIKNSMNLQIMTMAIIFTENSLLSLCIEGGRRDAGRIWFTVPIRSLISIGALPRDWGAGEATPQPAL